MMRRRSFLAASGASALAASLPGRAPGAPALDGTSPVDARAWPAAAAPGSMRARLHTLMGSEVVLVTPGGPRRARLAELSDGPVHPGLDQFHVRLDLAPGPPLGEGTYTVRHRALEPLVLHLQPASPGALRASFALLAGG